MVGSLKMKVTNLGIIFVCIIFSMILILNIRIDHLKSVSYEQLLMNRLIDTAIDDALFQVKNPNQLDEKALQRRFYKSLILNLDMPLSKESFQMLESSTPVMVLIENDGYRVLSHGIYNNENGFKAAGFKWQEKNYFITYDDNYIYHYHLDHQVACYPLKGQTLENINEITQLDFQWRHLDSFTKAHQSKMKVQVTQSIEIKINESIKDYNRYLERKGDTYQAYFPKSIGDHWGNNLSKPGLLVFFSGSNFW